MTPAPRRTPLHPYSPNSPVFSGRNGLQLAGSTARAAATTKRRSTVSFTTTTAAFALEDSRIPRTRKALTTRTTKAAGALKTASPMLPSGRTTGVPAAAVRVGGSWRPRSARKLTTYPDHPTATVAAPREYSRIRSHPMIHATSSPSVA